MSYLCGYHDYLQNLQAQLPWDLASGSVFLTGAHEVELQVFPQTLFLHLRIKRCHRVSATEDSCYTPRNSLCSQRSWPTLPGHRRHQTENSQTSDLRKSEGGSTPLSPAFACNDPSHSKRLLAFPTSYYTVSPIVKSVGGRVGEECENVSISVCKTMLFQK